MRHPVEITEVFGLRPLGPGLRQCVKAIAGDAHVPPSKFGPSSVRIFKPWLSLPLWLGRGRRDGRVAIYNLPNRRPAPRDEGYSVRVTYCRDFRGGQLTYDGHVGTDFAVRVGTEVVAAAPGVVRLVECDLRRGGLKVVVDHGGGLVTMSNHLSRALATPGRRVARGEVLGLSGMSGVDGLLFFPWLAPHLHFNVLLDGEPLDPFAAPGETPLWRAGNEPVPHAGDPDDAPLALTPWDREAVEASIVACRDPALRAALQAVATPDERAVAVTVARLQSTPAFDALRPLVKRPGRRLPWLDLPFRADDVTGVFFPDAPAA